MKHLLLHSLVGLLVTALIVATTIPIHAADDERRPNIIFMLSDDQAWNGLSVAMHPDVPGSKSELVQTPNLEKLAAQGMRFSAAYAPSPVCSATRISLQTGKSPAALHWTKAARSVRRSLATGTEGTDRRGNVVRPWRKQVRLDPQAKRRTHAHYGLRRQGELGAA